MSTADRIEELRKKFNENPRRYFAPLANELRKAGELEEAVALCREHLPKQPGHMSGYIVFGQALYESESLDEARRVFEQALSLDPENLIALRHLGDIARRQGDYSSARRWYERVLDTDPRNDDIAAQLAGLDSAQAQEASSHSRIPTPGVPIPVVPSPVAELQPVSFTPSVPIQSIGNIVPTPDSVLRAVDFDEVNRGLREPAVSFPAASSDVASLAPLPDAPESSAGTVDADDDLLDIAGFSLTGSPTRDDTEDDPFEFGSTAAEYVDEAGDQTEPARVDEADFEEGLAAPEWPDTSELSARVLTPRSITPVSVPATEEAVVAFGREPGDPVATPIPEPEPDVAPEEFHSAMSADVVEPEVADTLASDTTADQSAADDFVEVEEIHGIQTVSDAMEAPSEASLDVSLVAPEPAQDTAPVEEEPIEDVPADIPWLTGPEVALGTVGALAGAIGIDARKAGDSDVVLLQVADEPDDLVEPAPGETDSSTDESSGPQLIVEHHEAHEVSPVAGLTGAYDSEIGLDENSEHDDGGWSENGLGEDGAGAFVTETMGELLASQGFHERAVAVYEELVSRNPDDAVLAARLHELRMLAEKSQPEKVSVVENPLVPPSLTARERFRVLAARKVARRTPRVNAAVVTPDDHGLSSLFGSAADTEDDGAARMLAQAFRVPENLSLGDGESSLLTVSPTPASGAAAQDPRSSWAAPSASGTSATATSGNYAANRSGNVAAGSESNDHISFDRFFPDAALKSAPEGSRTPESADSDVTASASPHQSTPATADDLAQFSAWLKGLGNS